ncbi:MAG: hypothetical protein K2X39_02435, partial [Silvanigrellaceae bacterium]|nr:hypothetical protein [Silvanigrellaceae bacterium]
MRNKLYDNYSYEIPISPYSETFYNEWRIDENRSDYNLVVVQAFEGILCRKKLDQALKRLVSDYIILNSHIKERDNKLYWVKNKDVSGLDPKIILSSKEMADFILKPFDLNAGPLYRFALKENSPTHYEFVIILHHILIDGSSTDKFLDEISNYYNSDFYKCADDFDKQLKQITAVSSQLNEYMGEIQKESSLYWDKFLSNIDPLDLSFLKAQAKKIVSIKNRPSTVQDYCGIGEVRFSFDKAAVEKASQVCRHYKITSYIYSKIIFAILLHKYTGLKRFCTSYPVAIREGAELMHGGHVNTIFSSFDFDNQLHLGLHLDNLRQSIKSLKDDHLQHQYLPVPDILSLKDKKLLNVSFALTNIKEHKIELLGLKTSIVYGVNVDLSTDLSWEQDSSKNALSFCVKYKKDQINKDLLNEFIKSYKKIFIEITDNLLDKNFEENVSLNQIGLLNNDVFRKTTIDWNDTRGEYPRDKTVQELFEEQVERT